MVFSTMAYISVFSMLVIMLSEITAAPVMNLDPVQITQVDKIDSVHDEPRSKREPKFLDLLFGGGHNHHHGNHGSNYGSSGSSSGSFASASASAGSGGNGGSSSSASANSASYSFGPFSASFSSSNAQSGSQSSSGGFHDDYDY